MSATQKSLAPTTLERMLALGAIALLLAVSAAVYRGRAEWSQIPPLVWVHLGTIAVALVLTPVMLWRRRGDRLHRQLGWVWSGAMFGSALLSFNLRLINHGRFSLIHVLSALTVVLVPVLVLAARRHDVARHRRTARGLIVGALLIAGFFTFPFNRLLGHWLFG